MDETIQGLSAFVDKLNTLPLALGAQKNIIVRVLRKAGQPIAEAAERRAPVLNERERIQKRRKKEFRLVAGQLKRSQIVVVSEQTATGAVAKIGPSKLGFYGRWQEAGTARQPARPWLRPAFDERADEAARIIGMELAREIEKEIANP